MRTDRKRKNRFNVLALLIALVMLAQIILPGMAEASAAGDVTFTVTNLKTDGIINPIGIDNGQPEFSWQLQSMQIGTSQSAYHIIVTDEEGEVFWDSGKVRTNSNFDISYEGKPLRSTSIYTWTVTVWNEAGERCTSDDATFETALMDTTLNSWDGAEWISRTAFSLDSTSTILYDIRTTIQIQEGSTKAGIVFGADYFILNNDYMNVWKSACENYVKYEIDISDRNQPKLNIYAVGFPVRGQNEENAPEEPDFTISLENYIDESNAYAPHDIIISTKNGVNTLTFELDGATVDRSRVINPLGGSNNENAFPPLGSIGFAVEPDEEVVYTDMRLINAGIVNPGTTLFDSQTGAGYSIWEDKEGVEIQENSITVKGLENGTLCYANPSYGSEPMFRTEFQADGQVEKARLYITARGIYDTYINGREVSHDWFNPGNSEYRDHLAYQTFDVTELLQDGANGIGIQLAQGWWSGNVVYAGTSGVDNGYNYYGDKPALLAKLVINYKDGTQQKILSNTSDWKSYQNGPVVLGDFFMGQKYDALKEEDRWSQAGFNDSHWSNVQIDVLHNEKLSDYELVTRYDTPVHVVDTLTGVSLGEIGENAYIYDLGENTAGVPYITIPDGYVSEGDEIIIRMSEVLYPDHLEKYEEALHGTLMVENYRTALSTDFYICNSGENIIEPRYTSHGARYLEITGISKELPYGCVQWKGLSSVDTDVSYEGSNELVNRLFQNVINSHRSNFISLPTDCPQRSERLGWTGDAQVFSRAASYNADVLNFYRQWLVSFRDSQIKTGENAGYVPVTVPSQNPTYETIIDGFFSGISWDAALSIIPWEMYQQYGDTTIIAENLDAILLYLDFLERNPMSMTVDGIRITVPELTSKTGMLADWMSVVSTDAALINNAVYVYLMEITAKMAAAIGRDSIAEKMEQKHLAAKEKWNEIYIDPVTGQTRSAAGAVQNTQASYATPLRYNVISNDYRYQAAEHLNETVIAAGFTLTTGFSGTPNIVPALSDYGYIDTAYKLFENTEYASWLYSVVNGATSIWERWNSYTHEEGFYGSSAMNSFNHFSLGAISEWIVGYQLGITNDESSPGYEKIILQPTFGGDTEHVKGSFESNNGTIYSEWSLNTDGTLAEYKTAVPANATALLYLPLASDIAVGKVSQGIVDLGPGRHNEQNVRIFALESGGFEFSIQEGVLHGIISDGYSVSLDSEFRRLLGYTIIDAEEVMATDEYTNMIDSLKAQYESVLAEAEELYKDPNASDEQLFDMFLKLSDTMHNLGFQKGDKRLLLQMIRACENYNLELYTPLTAEVLQSELKNARIVYADGDALQGDIEKAIEILRQAMNGLRYRADKSVLASVIEKAEQLNLLYYTEESIILSDLANVIANARLIMTDHNASQEEVDEMAANLIFAMNLLEPLETKETDPDSGESDSEGSCESNSESNSESDLESNSEKVEDSESNDDSEKEDTDSEDQGKGNSTKDSGGTQGKRDGTDSSTGKSPKTGDSFNIIYLLLLTSSIALILTIKMTKLKR